MISKALIFSLAALGGLQFAQAAPNASSSSAGSLAAAAVSQSANPARFALPAASSIGNPHAELGRGKPANALAAAHAVPSAAIASRAASLAAASSLPASVRFRAGADRSPDKPITRVASLLPDTPPISSQIVAANNKARASADVFRSGAHAFARPTGLRPSSRKSRLIVAARSLHSKVSRIHNRVWLR